MQAVPFELGDTLVGYDRAKTSGQCFASRLRAYPSSLRSMSSAEQCNFELHRHELFSKPKRIRPPGAWTAGGILSYRHPRGPVEEYRCSTP